MKTDFSLTKKQLTEDGYVIREGLIFEAGDYPDKKFQLTPEELLAASADFKPVPLNLEHKKTIFDGKLGYLKSIKPSEDAYALYGEAAFPKWFDDLFGDEPIKVSCEWQRIDKNLEGLALTTNPRVKDAVLMSAFSESLIKNGTEPHVAFSESLAIFNDMNINKDKTWAGNDLMQTVHDICARAGAICVCEDVPAGETEDFVSQKEASSLQKMHDMAVESGAKCNFMYEEFSGSKKMSFVEKIKAKFNAVLDEEIASHATSEETKPVDLAAVEAALDAKLEAKLSEFTAVKTSLEEKNTQLEASLAEKEKEVAQFSKKLSDQELEAIKQSASVKVEELINAVKVLPAKREILVGLFTVLIADDAKEVGTVNFNNDKNEAVALSRVEALTELFSGAVSLKEEVPSSGNILGNNQGDQDTSHIERAKAFAAKMYKNRN